MDFLAVIQAYLWVCIFSLYQHIRDKSRQNIEATSYDPRVIYTAVQK